MLLFLALAIVTPVLFTLLVCLADKSDRKPIKTTWLLFLFGLLSVIPITVAEYVVHDKILPLICAEDSALFSVLNAFLVAGAAEELGKLLFLRIRTWKHRDFRCTYHAIVFAVSVSMGFACIESILYLINASLSDVIIRGLLCVPAHGCFGIIMGIFYGKAKQAELNGSRSEKNGALLLCLIIPMILHGCYDSCVFLSPQYAVFLLLMYLYVLFSLPVSIWLLLHHRKNSVPLVPAQESPSDGAVYENLEKIS